MSRARFEAEFYAHVVPGIEGVGVANQALVFDRVSMDRDPDSTTLSIIFRVSSRPGCRFGKRYRVWPLSTAEAMEAVDVANLTVVMLEEEIDAADIELPTDCGGDAIIWL